MNNDVYIPDCLIDEMNADVVRPEFIEWKSGGKNED